MLCVDKTKQTKHILTIKWSFKKNSRERKLTTENQKTNNDFPRHILGNESEFAYLKDARHIVG